MNEKRFYKNAIFYLFIVFFLGPVFSQTLQSSTKTISHFSDLPKCAENQDANKINFAKQSLWNAKISIGYPSLKSKFHKLPLIEQNKLVSDIKPKIEYPVPDIERTHFYGLAPGIKKLDALLKRGMIESVGAGDNIRKGTFRANTPIYLNQGKTCWTYDVAQGNEQAFDYDGFEEVAAVYSEEIAKCSAIIVGQSYAITAQHCAQAPGLLILPTSASRNSKNSSARFAKKCSINHQANEDCEYEVVSFTLVEAIPASNRGISKIRFQSPISDFNPAFEIANSPDLRLIKFERAAVGAGKPKKELITAKLMSYTATVSSDARFSFVRAGYGLSYEKSLALTIGSWSSAKFPVLPTSVSDLETTFLDAYVALFHTKEQKSRICEGDSGGALFWGTPNGKEMHSNGNGTRMVVGILSSAKLSQAGYDCIKSPVEISQVLSQQFIKHLCTAAKNQLNGC